jgi:hypothetical protein
MSENEFREHLDRASATVATWPEWKRNVLGQSEKSTVEHPRDFVDNELLDMVVFRVSMTTDERIEKLEREVAELRGMVTVLMGRTETLRWFKGEPILFVGPVPTKESEPEPKPPSPPMCDEGGWNSVPAFVRIGKGIDSIAPIHYPEEPPSWDITTMIEEGRKQMLIPEGERLVREAKQQDLPQCHL